MSQLRFQSKGQGRADLQPVQVPVRPEPQRAAGAFRRRHGRGGAPPLRFGRALLHHGPASAGGLASAGPKGQDTRLPRPVFRHFHRGPVERRRGNAWIAGIFGIHPGRGHCLRGNSDVQPAFAQGSTKDHGAGDSTLFGGSSVGPSGGWKTVVGPDPFRRGRGIDPVRTRADFDRPARRHRGHAGAQPVSFRPQNPGGRRPKVSGGRVHGRPEIPVGPPRSAGAGGPRRLRRRASARGPAAEGRGLESRGTPYHRSGDSSQGHSKIGATGLAAGAEDRFFGEGQHPGGGRSV